MSKVDPFQRYRKSNGEAKHRIIGASTGEVGTGKTTFWLGAPAPIVVQSLDRGLEGVVERFHAEKDIYIAEYDWSPTDTLTQEEAIELREKFTADFEHALKIARTIIWDKETDIWELFRYAEFGAPNDAPRNYPALNQRYRRLVNLPKETDVNFGVIQGMKDKWISRPNPKTGVVQGHNTGERQRQGFGEVDALVHLDLHHRREEGVFYLDVGKARGPGGQDVQDQTFENLSFVDFAQLVFPGTNEADWT